MKTAVTVTTTERISMDTWRDLKHTKVFEDTDSLIDIKIWIKKVISRDGKGKVDIETKDISLGTVDFSDVKE